MGNNEEDAYCNTRLQLGLGVGEEYYGAMQKKDDQGKNIKKKLFTCFDLWFQLCSSEEEATINNNNNINNSKDHSINPHADQGSNLKAFNTIDDQEEEEGNYFLTKNSVPNNNNGGRKKLKLSKDQSTLLEDSYKLHNTLNPAQKQALAEQLNLKPRQVEVWFQNRRARTKMKQTEEDYEFLKKYCESLRHENSRLRKELQELKSLKVEPSNKLHIQFPKTTKQMCSSCEKISRESSF